MADAGARKLALTALQVIEELTIENEALLRLLEEIWPHHYHLKSYQILQTAVEELKADSQVTGHLRQSFREQRERIERGVGSDETLELLKQFSPKGKPQ